jgi:hypothetical protein
LSNSRCSWLLAAALVNFGCRAECTYHFRGIPAVSLTVPGEQLGLPYGDYVVTVDEDSVVLVAEDGTIARYERLVRDGGQSHADE